MCEAQCMLYGLRFLELAVLRGSALKDAGLVIKVWTLLP